jgi:viroplasmin and RNaseH domain-containing protein
MAKYKKEKFKDLEEALMWCADNKPICLYGKDDYMVKDTADTKIKELVKYWKDFRKAIEIKPEKRKIEVWVNVYPDDNTIGYASKKDADRWASGNRIACIKLEKEIEILDGEVVSE